MAETGTAPAVRTTQTAPATQNPDTLVREIERTRENLARTIDAIADRVSPANNARRAVERAREQVSRVDVRYVAAGAAVAVGVTAAFLIWRGRR
ncbi:MAG: DUF3618 domain-containing protein [Kitasatospora sp.]|jgi:hypothetical protein|nr:DUF3618 domain-containing protein [Kitasatospora sp.]